MADRRFPATGVRTGVPGGERSVGRGRYDAGSLLESVSRDETLPRRVESEDMDLPHRVARGREPKTLVVPA